MIRHRSSPRLFPHAVACIVLGCVGRGGVLAGEHKSAPQPSADTRESATPAPADSVAVPPASKRSTDEVQSLLKLGSSMTERNDFESAEIAFHQVLNTPAVEPQELGTALLGLARMYRKQGTFTKATAIFERFFKEFPGDGRTPDALLELGRTLRDLGVYKLAIDRFYSVINSTLKMPPEGFERYQVLAKTAQFEIAETHFVAGNFAEAGKFYTRLRLLELAPVDRARAHWKAGHALRLQGDLENAVATLRAYIEQWPEDENIPEARYLLAVTLGDLKRSQEAFAATLDLLRTEKSRTATDAKRWAYWQRRTGNQLANYFYEGGDAFNAQAIYSNLIELSPEPSWRLPVTYQLALCYERLGAPDRARLSYQSIIDATSKNQPADLAELARMAAWRIEHLQWRDRVDQQLTKMFETNTGKQAATPSPASSTGATP